MSLNQIIVENEIGIENHLFMVEQQESNGPGDQTYVVNKFIRIIIK